MYVVYSLLAAVDVLVFQVQYTYSVCSPDTNGNPRAGIGCEYKCHCKNASEQCDNITGHCDSGCATGWMGSGCQYRDLAFGQYCIQIDSHISDKDTFHANDDDLTTCSRTDVPYSVAANRRTTEPWWQVNVADTTVILGLVITTESGAEDYFVGFKVYVEITNLYNNSGYQKQQTCYTHDGKTSTHTTMHVTCNEPLLGNRVKIQLASKHSQLVLCDVKIYEGYSRRNIVGDDLLITSCNISKWWMVNLGQIYTLYTILFHGNRVDCPKYQCGLNCTEPCYCKDFSMHDRLSGICQSGCDARWSGEKCNIGCRIPPDRITGYCHINECPDDKWGPICRTSCGYCLNSEPCNAETGQCPDGCKSGYKDNIYLCDTPCDNGRYGHNCALNCSGHCKDGAVCRKDNGLCHNGCAPGWKGEKCNDKCDHGKYGKNCAERCNVNCLNTTACMTTDGHCGGCQAGYRGYKCEQECGEGEWGESCTNVCGSCYGDITCDVINGTCINGCMPGYKTTAMCTKECEGGTYGISCTYTCGNCQGGVENCNKSTGSCSLGCTEGFDGATCHSHIPSTDLAAAVGFGVAAILVIAVVTFAVFAVRHKQRNKQCIVDTFELYPASPDSTTEHVQAHSNNRNDICIYSADDYQQQSITPSNTRKPTGRPNPTNLHIDTPIQRKLPKQAVLLTSLNEYIRSNMLHKDHLTREFNTLPYGLVHPATVAVKPTNRPKNRYRDMYAYDHSRVVLQTFPGQPDSDYINASVINGHKKKNAYIATQAPTTDTIDEFWMMIWEKEVSKIVMVTNLIEEGKAKCHQYWNCEEMTSYGDISVTVDSEEVFAEFTIRTFILKSISTKQWRKVTQFHFTVWPDKSTPKRLTSLVQFWSKVRKDDVESSHPWLVHCSAGVGRTGTFIALDILYDQGKELNYVNVYQCVQELRQQRVNMVQTQEQYTYLHEVVSEALVIHSQAIPIQDFANEYRNLLQVERTTGITGLMSIFERIQADIVDLSNEDLTDIEEAGRDRKDVFAAAKRTENRNKNRYNNILASNNYRPFLSSHVPGCNDYINAVYVPSNRNLRGYILSQTPLENTAVDCCRLVSEHKIQVIVTFDDSGSEKVGNYLPDTGTLTVGPFEVELTSEERKDDYNIRNYKMQFKGEGQWCIMQIVFTKWSSDDTVPRDHNALLNIIQEVEAQQKLVKGTCILVQCLNGAERSGLFVVLMNVLERMRIEQEVAIPQVIRQMRQIRRQILPNSEQYKFCHDVVLRHVQNTSS